MSETQMVGKYFVYKLESKEDVSVSGHVTIVRPSLGELLELSSKYGFAPDASGGTQAVSNSVAMAKAVVGLGEFIKEVDVVLNGQDIKDWDLFCRFGDLYSDAIKIVTMFMGGFKAGKN